MDRTEPTGTTLEAVSRRTWMVVLLLAIILTASGSALLRVEAAGTIPPSAQSTPDVAATPTAQTPVAGTPRAANPCDALAPGTGSEPWVQTELYFGRSIPGGDGATVTDEQWQDFLDTEVTPRFPDGLTVLDGYGQFLNASGVIAQEDSTVLIILYPMDPSGATSAQLDEIREAYKAEFNQESVLRTDTYPVCTAF